MDIKDAEKKLNQLLAEEKIDEEKELAELELALKFIRQQIALSAEILKLAVAMAATSQSLGLKKTPTWKYKQYIDVIERYAASAIKYEEELDALAKQVTKEGIDVFGLIKRDIIDEEAKERGILMKEIKETKKAIAELRRILFEETKVGGWTMPPSIQKQFVQLSKIM